MQGFQQYQKYRLKQEKKGFRYGRILIILGVLVVLFFIVKAMFNNSGNVDVSLPANDQNANQEDLTLADNGNANEAVNVNSEANANNNENVNGNVNINASSSSLDPATCDRVYSRGNTLDKEVSLTFNVGTTKEGEVQGVLDALKNASVPADFFARGDVAENNPDLINKISQAGFPIHNLSYDHPHFNSLSALDIADELSKAETQISQKTGQTTKPYFRPPYGEADDDVVAAASDAGYCTITWSIDALDWSSDYTANQSEQRVLDNVSAGSIVLMQAANSISSQILPDLISQLKSQGYEIVSLDDMF